MLVEPPPRLFYTLLWGGGLEERGIQAQYDVRKMQAHPCLTFIVPFKALLGAGVNTADVNITFDHSVIKVLLGIVSVGVCAPAGHDLSPSNLLLMQDRRSAGM